MSSLSERERDFHVEAGVGRRGEVWGAGMIPIWRNYKKTVSYTIQMEHWTFENRRKMIEITIIKRP